MKRYFVGRRDYASTLRLQERIFSQKIKRQVCCQRGETHLPPLPDVTILVEHSEPVYTVGRRDTSVGLPPFSSVEVVKVRRGGGITYHGPGQLTAYPIANIQHLWKRSINAHKVRSPIEWFSEVLERAMVSTAVAYGIPCYPHKTGVWTEAVGDQRARKIGSIGLQLGSWVSMHGASFNVSPDLQHFNNIVMCEMPGESATSLEAEFALRHLTTLVPSVDCVSAMFVRRFCEGLAQPEGYLFGDVVDLSGKVCWEARLIEDAGFCPTS